MRKGHLALEVSRKAQKAGGLSLRAPPCLLLGAVLFLGLRWPWTWASQLGLLACLPCLVNMFVCVWGTAQMEAIVDSEMNEKALDLTCHYVWTLLHETDLGEGGKGLVNTCFHISVQLQPWSTGLCKPSGWKWMKAAR